VPRGSVWESGRSQATDKGDAGYLVNMSLHPSRAYLHQPASSVLYFALVLSGLSASEAFTVSLRNVVLHNGLPRPLTRQLMQLSAHPFVEFSSGAVGLDGPSLSPAAGFPSLVTSEIYTTSPAHGHSQPFWGPPDPYLISGKSIAPSMQALAELGAGSRDGLPEPAQRAIAEGYRVLDATTIQPESILPGFAKVGLNVPVDTPESFALQVEWAANFLNVVDQLPVVAFSYVLIEFFLIRPNLDVYKEDVESEPGSVLAETVGVTAIRLSVFCVLALVTLTFVG
jgi:hypothetical protein